MKNQHYYDLSGSVYMVTGAGSGIGAATVRLLNRSNARVVLVGRDAGKLNTVVETLGQPELAEVYVANVAKTSEVKALVQYIEDKYKRLDGAFNNAGIFGDFGLLENDEEENFSTVVDTNLRGIWACMKYQIPAVRKVGGAIVNCSSVAGHQGHAMSPIYSATKHAVIGLSKSVALQYAASGLRVNVLSPGSTDTPILRSLYKDEQTFNQRASRAPMGRVGSPEEIAQAAVWLLSSQSSYVNGQTLLVDGGVMAGNSPTQPAHASKPVDAIINHNTQWETQNVAR